MKNNSVDAAKKCKLSDYSLTKFSIASITRGLTTYIVLMHLGQLAAIRFEIFHHRTHFLQTLQFTDVFGEPTC